MVLRITTAVLIALAASTGHAASGFFNMPTSLPQCLGCGWGPGYHAEMVLKPYYRSWNASQGIVRAQPRHYPPIYHQHAGYGSHEQPMAAPQQVMVYTGPPVQAMAPAGVHAPLFAAPPVYSSRPARPLPRPEEAPAEPGSPSDVSEPELLPLP